MPSGSAQEISSEVIAESVLQYWMKVCTFRKRWMAGNITWHSCMVINGAVIFVREYRSVIYVAVVQPLQIDTSYCTWGKKAVSKPQLPWEVSLCSSSLVIIHSPHVSYCLASSPRGCMQGVPADCGFIFSFGLCSPYEIWRKFGSHLAVGRHTIAHYLSNFVVRSEAYFRLKSPVNSGVAS